MISSTPSNLKNVSALYAQSVGARIAASTIKKQLQENPYYPSIYSLSETFKRYNISGGSWKVSSEKFDQMEPPFLAFLKLPGNFRDFVLVKNIEKDAVTYIHEGSRPVRMSMTDFLQGYQNIVWAADVDRTGGDPAYEADLKLEKKQAAGRLSRMMAAIAAVVLILLLASAGGGDLVAFAGITLLKMLGIALTLLLIGYDIDKSTSLVKDVCGAGKRLNCDSVIHSRHSGIGGVGWSEIGLIYFLSGLLGVLAPGIAFPEKIAILSIANALAVPYVLFSVYYQWRIVKQWCPLCLGVQAVLLGELIFCVSVYWHHPFVPTIGLPVVAAILVCLLLPIVVFYSLRPLLLKARDADNYQYAYKRLQYNRDTFESLLKQQSRLPDGWESLGITLGNPAGKTQLVKVCNPYCGPCAKMHPLLEKVTQLNKDVQLRIIFTASDHEWDRQGGPVRHFMALEEQYGHPVIQEALDTWYAQEKKDYKAFATQYPVQGDLLKQSEKLTRMAAWCDEAEITHTPTLFVNGHRIPQGYGVDQLEYLLS